MTQQGVWGAGRAQGGPAEAADAVGRRLGTLEPRVAIVLGSGLGGLADTVRDAIRLPYAEIPGFPAPGAPGHKGELVAGMLEGVPVLVQSGRFHLYEGHAPSVAGLPVRVFARLGVPTLIVTNAAGGIRHTFRPPTLMLIADHINLMWRNPLVGPVEEGEERFPDMSDPYDPELRALAREVARQERVSLEEGVYAALLGPSFETPAEIRMLSVWAPTRWACPRCRKSWWPGRGGFAAWASLPSPTSRRACRREHCRMRRSWMPAARSQARSRG